MAFPSKAQDVVGGWRIAIAMPDAAKPKPSASRNAGDAGRGGDHAGERGKHDLADAIAGHPQRERGAGGLGGAR